MTRTSTTLAAPAASGTGGPGASTRWSWPHYLALLGVPILVWEAWTITAWLVDGPRPISGFGQQNTANWWAARIWEAAIILMSIVMLVYLIRGCRREGKLLTFDVMFCICGFTLIWDDFGTNVFQPVFLVSSNFVNLNAMCGHMPFVINADCGRGADAVLFFWPAVTFGWLAFAVGIDALLRRARRRWPHLSTIRLTVMVLLIAGGLVDVLFEVPSIALGLWTYTTWPSVPLGHGGAHAWPLIAPLFGLLYWGLLFVVRAWRDDRGRRFVERGVERHSPRVQKTITLLALYTVFQFVAWVPGTLPFWLAELYLPRWKETPAYLLNDACDAPGVSGTRYGPCPGSPGYRMPIRNS